MGRRRTELVSAFGLLTRLPVADLTPPGDYADPARAVWAYPLAGLAVGLIGGLVYWLAAALAIPPMIAGVLALGAMVLATGGLHEDGLADTADGLGGGRDKARKLEIMRDSRIGSYGVIALDARIRVAEATKKGADRLAIRPYPKELEEVITLDDRAPLLLRPVVPEDEPSLQAGFAKLTPEEIRLRFAVPKKALTHVDAARFTQIDYDREMALVLTDPGIPGQTELYGVVRISTDADNERAEYAIIVRKAMAGRGLGSLLMNRIIDYARSRGTKEIYGYVLAENHTMLDICERLGFDRKPGHEDPGVVYVSLRLDGG